MNRVFLGKWIHWLVVILLVAVGWIVGLAKTHVIHFNWFVVGALTLAVVAILVVLRTTAPGEQVTRGPIAPDQD